MRFVKLLYFLIDNKTIIFIHSKNIVSVVNNVHEIGGKED